MKTTFKGTINGKEFTNKTEFLEELNNLQSSKLKDVRYNETTESEESVVEQSIDLDELTNAVNMFTGLFGFRNTRDQVMKQAKALGLPVVDSKEAAQTKEKAEKEEVVYKNYKEFILPMTTYKFDGTSRDDDELDKFDRFLSNKILDFVDNCRPSEESRAAFLAERNNLTHKVTAANTLIDNLYNMQTLYEKIDNVFPADLQTRLDAKISERNYYSLLEKYYNDLASF